MPKKLTVQCERGPIEHKETIGSLAQKIFDGAKNLEVLINQNLCFLPTAPSIFSAAQCPVCEGKGWIATANGADDFDKDVCKACQGTGRVLAN